METITNIEPLKSKIHQTLKINPEPVSELAKLGYLFLFVSLLLFGICEYFRVKENLFMLFFVHYIISMVYMFVLMFNRSYGIRRSWKKENINKTMILLNLFLISAFALNREITVFENSVNWLRVYILLTSAALLSYEYADRLPLWVNNIQHFLLGSAVALYLYLALYVANYYPVGAIGMIALGIGGHIFVPLALLIASIFLFVHFRKHRINNYSIMAGFLFPVLLAISFMVEWNSRISEMEKISNQSAMYNETELPVWVNVAESLENDWISERILKTDLVYTTAKYDFDEWWFMPQNVSWDEIKKHDPLVYIASLKSKSSLPDDERVKILKSITNGRHQANERLWSGDNLTTSYIISDIDIYTDLRLAYTEQYLNIRNNSLRGSWWGNTEEGIYTFYLPPGSVVTSLSLWINGREEKAILTSKQKADKAYKTIVGVERRDPSVVHWQEGNTVTVRVFPCTDKEERKFKIGITSPLQVKDGQVIYKNILFDGPDPSNATETRRIRFIGGKPQFDESGNFEKTAKGDYITENKYDPDFTFSYPVTVLKSNRFTNNGYSYSLADLQPRKNTVEINSLFLDINNSWHKNELRELRTLVLNHEVYVSLDEELIKLTDSNWSKLTAAMRERNFSLFPYHKLTDIEQSLVVTKGNRLSPHLSDIKESKFAKGVSTFFASGKKVKVFNINGVKSTYTASLTELRGLEFCEGDIAALKKILETKVYPGSVETDNVVALHEAGMIITRTTDSTSLVPGNAPDHLARLFAYNDIMRKVSSGYFNDDYVNEALVDEAATAYIVSPVSSLIVLETQEDYKRFGIADKGNSLNNAARQSSGSVPEPHEWVLIIMFVAFAFYLKFRN
ncbi:XrtN system VIT domain-containing protein [Flavitalea sp.]|nr:XrtN system VIT domain-containing protein [Flavitalea sp.]